MQELVKFEWFVQDKSSVIPECIHMVNMLFLQSSFWHKMDIFVLVNRKDYFNYTSNNLT